MKCFKNKPVNDSTCFSGCPYHIIHNGAQKGGEAFACKSKFDTEYMMIDQYHWFVYQAKKKLLSFCKFGAYGQCKNSWVTSQASVS